MVIMMSKKILKEIGKITYKTKWGKAYNLIKNHDKFYEGQMVRVIKNNSRNKWYSSFIGEVGFLKESKYLIKFIHLEFVLTLNMTDFAFRKMSWRKLKNNA